MTQTRWRGVLVNSFINLVLSLLQGTIIFRTLNLIYKGSILLTFSALLVRFLLYWSTGNICCIVCMSFRVYVRESVTTSKQNTAAQRTLTSSCFFFQLYVLFALTGEGFKCVFFPNIDSSISSSMTIDFNWCPFITCTVITAAKDDTTRV